VLVFSRTKYGADKISRRLKRAGVIAVPIHSGRTQNQRQRALDGFRSGKYQVMVATDIAARGIDVEGISHVINYDVPTHAEDYVHRIGRTGRAEATGDAITFVSSEEEKYLREVGKFIERKLTAQKCKGFSYVKSPRPETKTAKSSEPSRRKELPRSKCVSRARNSYRGRRKQLRGRSCNPVGHDR
jgi:ATP-dependent RNA helicase RhlE